MSIRRHQGVGPIEDPGRNRDFPWQDRPPGLTANRKGQSDRSGPAHLDASIGDGPRCDLTLALAGWTDSVKATLALAHTGQLALARCLRGDNIDPVVLVETSHPASATCAEASIPVEDKRGALGPLFRKLTEVDTAHAISVPAAD